MSNWGSVWLLVLFNCLPMIWLLLIWDWFCILYRTPGIMLNRAYLYFVDKLHDLQRTPFEPSHKHHYSCSIKFVVSTCLSVPNAIKRFILVSYKLMMFSENRVFLQYFMNNPRMHKNQDCKLAKYPVLAVLCIIFKLDKIAASI